MASLIRNADIAPDAAIASTKLAAWAANRSAGGFKLTSLAAGVDPGDAVNKAQLDAAVGGGGGTWGSIIGTLSDQTDLQAALDAKQPLDGTLTAFAALTIAANSLTIGTGSDAFLQTTFGINTFPARASAGALSAKPITDFALSILDDADAATVRATIGAGTGNGTVTAVSIFSANGVSGSSSGGATPALTIALGAITPSSVASTGAVTGTNLSGTNTGDQTITLSGDISGTGTGAITTVIGAGKVTLAMMANLVQSTFIGRAAAAGTGVPQALTAAQAKTILDLTGTNSGDQTITLSGDVSGSGTGAITATIGTGVVTYAKIQNVTTNRLLGRSTAGVGVIEEISIGTGLSLSAGTLSSTDVGGTVTNFSAGDLSPLFTTTEATTTTTPALSFVLSDAAANTFFGNGTGSLGPPSFMSASTARTTLGGTTVGQSFFTLTNPTAITFPRINADNTVSALDAATFRTAIGAGTGSGTVIAVSIATANGVSGSSSGGATPALTIALGAITPSSVAASGTISGSNLSGTNTGDQIVPVNTTGTATQFFSAYNSATGVFTKTQPAFTDISGSVTAAQMPALTGDVTTSAGTVATTIANDAVITAKILNTNVTYAKIQNVVGLSVFGRSASSTGAGSDITGTANQVLRVNSAGNLLIFGTVAYAGIQNVAALSVFGRSANTSGVGADITGTDTQVLRVSGTTLGFGTIVPAAIAMTTNRLLGRSATSAGEEIIIGTGLSLSAGTLTATGSGTVTSVTGTAPIVSSGGTTPAISITAATAGAAGSMSAADKTKLDAITGTNTGDQTITLSGDVTGSGTGNTLPTTTTIANDAVTLAKMANMATASFLGRNAVGTGDPEVLSIATASSMLNLAGLYQPLDGDLTAIAAITTTAATGIETGMIYATSANNWSRVSVGQGLNFTTGILRLAIRDESTPGGTISAASTLNLTGLTGLGVIEVTGATDIDAITLADGEQVTLRFTGAGLTINPDASLVTLGGVPLVVTTDAQAVITASGGVVTITDYQTATAYSIQTFDNIYMNPGANIGFANESAPFFDIGRTPGAVPDQWIRVLSGDDVGIFRDTGAGIKSAKFDLTGLTVSRLFSFPDYPGTFSIIDGVESLTNKKLGSLTTNGFVKTSGSDGTLSVDTTAYGTVTNFSAGDLSPLFTTSEATTSTTPALTFSLSTAAANTFFGNGTGGAAAPTFMSAATARTALGGVVIGPASSFDANIATFDGTTGKMIQDSGLFIDPAATPDTVVSRDGSGNITGVDFYGNLFLSTNLIAFAQVTSATASLQTLTNGSGGIQIVTGTSTNTTFKLPVATTLTEGHPFWFRNEQTGTGTLIVQYSGGTTAITLAPGTTALFFCKNPSAGTSGGSWTNIYFGTSVTTAKKLSVSNSLTLAGTDGTTQTFPSTSCSVARIDAAQSFTGDQTFGAKIIGGAAIRLKGYTVATLPAGTQGDTAFVTDALTPTFLVAAVGGGAVVSPVFYNGAAWVSY